MDRLISLARKLETLHRTGLGLTESNGGILSNHAVFAGSSRGWGFIEQPQAPLFDPSATVAQSEKWRSHNGY
jgi:hypothetical protein